MTDEFKLVEFMSCLGHEFSDPELLKQALTHPSLSGIKSRQKSVSAPYERMEFLGDRVLGLVIAAWVYDVFPNANEGEMARRHAALVNRDALRGIALDIGLEKYVRLAHGDAAEGSKRKNLAALSDAMEAVIGALYLDGGLEAAQKFIYRYWKDQHAGKDAPVDPKSALQEWAQGNGLPLPVYKVLQRSGPAHAPKFIIEVSVKGHAPTKAEGESKRNAEKAAAEELMEQILSA